MQITVPIEKLGMYGQDPVPFGGVYVGTGDCGLVLTGGTLGATIIAGAAAIRGYPTTTLSVGMSPGCDILCEMQAF